MAVVCYQGYLTPLPLCVFLFCLFVVVCFGGDVVKQEPIFRLHIHGGVPLSKFDYDNSISVI